MSNDNNNPNNNANAKDITKTKLTLSAKLPKEQTNSWEFNATQTNSTTGHQSYYHSKKRGTPETILQHIQQVLIDRLNSGQIEDGALFAVNMTTDNGYNKSCALLITTRDPQEVIKEHKAKLQSLIDNKEENATLVEFINTKIYDVSQAWVGSMLQYPNIGMVGEPGNGKSQQTIQQQLDWLQRQYDGLPEDAKKLCRLDEFRDLVVKNIKTYLEMSKTKKGLMG